jgi:hypothetical protein
MLALGEVVAKVTMFVWSIMLAYFIFIVFYISICVNHCLRVWKITIFHG